MNTGDKERDLVIAVGIPSQESIPSECFTSHMCQLGDAMRCGKIVMLTPFNASPHDKARTVILEDALEKNVDYLYFIDDDMLIPRGTLPRMLEVFKQNPGLVAVSGHYYRRGSPYTCVWSMEIDGQWNQVDALDGVHTIHTSGLGCCLIDVKWVKQHLTYPYFEMKHNGKYCTVTDDITFFEKIRAAGGTVVGDAGIRCGHLTRIVINDASVKYLRRLELEDSGELTKVE